MESTALEEYTIEKFLHANETTLVSEVTSKSGGKKFVGKRVLKTPFNELKLHWETDLLRRIEHPNVITLHDWDENEDFVFMVFEKMDGDLLGLFDRLGSLPEPRAIPVIVQILKGVEFLHSHNILHRDLKVDNILYEELKDGTIRIAIADFGFAILTNTPIKEALGTPLYAAPEVFRSTCGKPVDMWAIGIISYGILTGGFPFYHDDYNTLVDKIFHNPVVWPDTLNVSDNAKNFIESLLRKEPSKRITASQALKHPFITGRKVIS